MSHPFRLTVLDGREGPADPGDGAPLSVAGGAATNPIFEAYARRTVPKGQTARQALALALAEAVEPVDGPGDGADDFASYGVTHAPFMSAAERAPLPPPPPPPAAPPVKVAAVSLKRRPSLRVSAPPDAPPPEPASEAPAPPLAMRSPMPNPSAYGEPALPEVDDWPPLSPLAPLVPLPSPGVVSNLPPPPAFVPPPDPEAFAAMEDPLLAGRPKMALKRSDLPPDVSFMPQSFTDGARAPLLPLPVPAPVYGAPEDRIPTSGQLPDGGFAGAEEQPVASPKKAKLEWKVWLGRAAVLGVAGAFLFLAWQGWQLRRQMPAASPEAPVSASAVAAAAGIAPFWTVEIVEPAREPLRNASGARGGASGGGGRPAPSREFTRFVEGLKITGVLQGNPVRAIVDGRVLLMGDLVEVSREVRLAGQDVANRRLIFEDRTGAQASARY